MNVLELSRPRIWALKDFGQCSLNGCIELATQFRPLLVVIVGCIDHLTDCSGMEEASWLLPLSEKAHGLITRNQGNRPTVQFIESSLNFGMPCGFQLGLAVLVRQFRAIIRRKCKRCVQDEF